MKYDLADYDELVLTHLIRSKKVFELAKELKLSGDDFLSSQLLGEPVYKLIAESILAINTSPINPNLLLVEIKSQAEASFITDLDSIPEFIETAYAAILNEDIICLELPAFIRHRRLLKAHEQNRKDPTKLYEEMNKIAVDLSTTENKQNVVSSNPFAAPVYVKQVAGIPTGFTKIDLKLHGLARGECGLLIGHSGSGKTAVASNFARLAALEGFKVLYFSLEEPYQNIVHRWYASQFNISYTQLHFGINPGSSGSTQKMDLQVEFDNMDPTVKETLGNLRIIDARAKTPINTDELKTLLEEEAAKGFIPDVVIIDQLDYMEPLKKMPPGVQDWQKYQQTAFELDYFSQYKIAGEHEFGLWVVHQGKGGMKWEFGYDDIAGFRGIVKPFDMCLGVGRFSKEEPYINLFSIKTRHTEHVKQSYYAEFQYMKFTERTWTPPDKEAPGKKYNLVKVKPGLKQKREFQA